MEKECPLQAREQNALNSYLGNLLVSLDQTGNAIAGGYADSTVSARIGYYSYKKYEKRKWRNRFWKSLRSVIDWAFFPLDGEEHCRQAYCSDHKELFVHGSDVSLFVLGFLVLLFAPVLGVVIRVWELIKFLAGTKKGH